MPNTTPDTIIDLLRHGKVAGKPALYGRTNIAMSDVGWRQTKQILTDYPTPDRLITSPLLRCKEIADYAAKQYQMEAEISDGIKECDFGRFDGVPFDEIGDDWQLLDDFWRDPANNMPPQGEHLDAMYQRVINAWQHILDTSAGKRVLVVCHGGVIRHILAHILNIDWRSPNLYQQFDISYSSITRISRFVHPEAKPIIRHVAIPSGNLKTTI